MNKKSKVLAIREIFNRLYNDADCTLNYETPLQLLISTQLAAQCTDERVNIVAKTLYKKYKTVQDFANADLKTLENDIRSTGFYHNKAKNIIACCKTLINEFNGIVPDNMDDLLKLAGVGRKTANLVLGDVFGTPGIVVDTHAKRITNRIGLTKETNPVKIEFDLLKIVPKDYQTLFCHQLVLHGRAVCNARKPKCENCEISKYCNYYEKQEPLNITSKNAQ